MLTGAAIWQESGPGRPGLGMSGPVVAADMAAGGQGADADSSGGPIASWSAGRLRLHGHVADQSERILILARAVSIYGADAIDDALVVDPNAAGNLALSAIDRFPPDFREAARAQARLSGRGLEVEGEVEDGLKYARLVESISAGMAGGQRLENRLAIDPAVARAPHRPEAPATQQRAAVDTKPTAEKAVAADKAPVVNPPALPSTRIEAAVATPTRLPADPTPPVAAVSRLAPIAEASEPTPATTSRVPDHAPTPGPIAAVASPPSDAPPPGTVAASIRVAPPTNASPAGASPTGASPTSASPTGATNGARVATIEVAMVARVAAHASTRPAESRSGVTPTAPVTSPLDRAPTSPAPAIVPTRAAVAPMAAAPTPLPAVERPRPMLEPVVQDDPLPAQWQGRKRRLALASAGSTASVASAEPKRPSAGSDPVLPRLTFFQGSARLTKQARAALRKLSRQLKAAPGARFVIAGHTDDRGGGRLNQRLSRDRAKAALAFLVAQGVSGDRFELEGHGASQPVADNETVAGRWQNRRVEFRRLA